MNKGLFLHVARGVRRERAPGQGKQIEATGFDMISTAVTVFEKRVGGLNGAERNDLFQSLLRSLEKERRRCKARKGTYDAGRHISLFIAVRSLAGAKEKPPA